MVPGFSPRALIGFEPKVAMGDGDGGREEVIESTVVVESRKGLPISTRRY